MAKDDLVFTATREKETKNMTRFEEDGKESDHVMGKPYFYKSKIGDAKKIRVTVEVVE